MPKINNIVPRPFSLSRTSEEQALNEVRAPARFDTSRISQQLQTLRNLAQSRLEENVARESASTADAIAREKIAEFKKQRDKAYAEAALGTAAGDSEAVARLLGTGEGAKGELKDPEKISAFETVFESDKSISELLRHENDLVRRVGTLAFNDRIRKAFLSEFVSDTTAFLDTQLSEFSFTKEMSVTEFASQIEAHRQSNTELLNELDPTGKLALEYNDSVEPLYKKYQSAAVNARLDTEEAVAISKIEQSIESNVKAAERSLFLGATSQDEFIETLGKTTQSVVSSLNTMPAQFRAQADKYVRETTQRLVTAYYIGNFVDVYVRRLEALRKNGNVAEYAKVYENALAHIRDVMNRGERMDTELAGYKPPVDPDENPTLLNWVDYEKVSADLRRRIAGIGDPSSLLGGKSVPPDIASVEKIVKAALSEGKSAINQRSALTVLGPAFDPSRLPSDEMSLTQYLDMNIEMLSNAQRLGLVSVKPSDLNRMKALRNAVERYNNINTAVRAAVGNLFGLDTDVPVVQGADGEFLRPLLEADTLEEVGSAVRLILDSAKADKGPLSSEVLPEGLADSAQSYYQGLLKKIETAAKEKTQSADLLCDLAPASAACSFDVARDEFRKVSEGKSDNPRDGLAGIADVYVNQVINPSVQASSISGREKGVLPTGFVNSFVRSTRAMSAEERRNHFIALGTALATEANKVDIGVIAEQFRQADPESGPATASAILAVYAGVQRGIPADAINRITSMMAQSTSELNSAVSTLNSFSEEGELASSDQIAIARLSKFVSGDIDKDPSVIRQSDIPGADDIADAVESLMGVYVSAGINRNAARRMAIDAVRMSYAKAINFYASSPDVSGSDLSNELADPSGFFSDFGEILQDSLKSIEARSVEIEVDAARIDPVVYLPEGVGRFRNSSSNIPADALLRSSGSLLTPVDVEEVLTIAADELLSTLVRGDTPDMREATTRLMTSSTSGRRPYFLLKEVTIDSINEERKRNGQPLLDPHDPKVQDQYPRLNLTLVTGDGFPVAEVEIGREFDFRATEKLKDQLQKKVKVINPRLRLIPSTNRTPD